MTPQTYLKMWLNKGQRTTSSALLAMNQDTMQMNAPDPTNDNNPRKMQVQKQLINQQTTSMLTAL
jgi:hypothetical protein